MSSTPQRAQTVREWILGALERVERHYNADIDEMELVLPGAAGREGWAMLVDDDLYVRLDVDTNEPLSIIIPGWRGWLARQTPPPVARPAPPQQWTGISWDTAQHAIQQKVKYSAQLGALAVR